MIPVRGMGIIDRKLKAFISKEDKSSRKIIPQGLKKSPSKAKMFMQSPTMRPIKGLSNLPTPKLERIKTKTISEIPRANTFRGSFRRKSDDLASTESEGTRLLHDAFDENPQAFIKVDSQYFSALPPIDQARVFILERKPDDA